MITATEVQYEVRRRLNRFNEDYSKKLVVPAIDSYINEAISILEDNSAILYEVRGDVAINLLPLEVRDQSLKISKKDKKVSSELPPDWYKITRIVAIAKHPKCEGTRELVVRKYQTQKISDSIKSPYLEPSYEWEETIGIHDTDKYLEVYHNNKFSIEQVIIDYIKKHPKVYTPSLTEEGKYQLASGEWISEDQGLYLDSHNQARQAYDVAALIAMRDLSDMEDFQSQLNKIMFTNTHQLG